MIEEKMNTLEKRVSVLEQKVEEMRASGERMKEISLGEPSLRLSRRALNVLERAGCATTGDVRRFGVKNIRKIHGCGQGTYEEIERMMQQFA